MSLRIPFVVVNCASNILTILVVVWSSASASGQDAASPVADPANASARIGEGRPVAAQTASLAVEIDGEPFPINVAIHREGGQANGGGGAGPVRARYFHTPLLLPTHATTPAFTGAPSWVHDWVPPTSELNEGFVTRLAVTNADVVEAATSAVLFETNASRDGISIVPWPARSASAVLIDRFDASTILATGGAQEVPNSGPWDFLLRFADGVTWETVLDMEDRATLVVAYTYPAQQSSNLAASVSGEFGVGQFVRDSLTTEQRDGSADAPIFMQDVRRVRDGVRGQINIKITTNDPVLIPYADGFLDKAMDGVFSLQSRIDADIDSVTSLSVTARGKVAEYLNATVTVLEEKSKEYDETIGTDRTEKNFEIAAKGKVPSGKVSLKDIDEMKTKRGVEFTKRENSTIYEPKEVSIYSLNDADKQVDLSSYFDVVVVRSASLASSGKQRVGLRFDGAKPVVYQGSFALFTCEPCHGAGRIVCQSCNGAGRSVCGTCNGKAIVAKSVSFPRVISSPCRICNGDGSLDDTDNKLSNNRINAVLTENRYRRLGDNSWNTFYVTNGVCTFCKGTGVGANAGGTTNVSMPLPCEQGPCRGGYEMCAYEVQPPEGDKFLPCSGGTRTCQTCSGSGARVGNSTGQDPLP